MSSIVAAACRPYPVELPFLLSCCVAQASQLAQDGHITELDWNLLEAIARRHGVLPLVAKRITGSPTALAGDSVVRRLATSAASNQLRNQYLTARLLILLKQFDDESIPVLTIKGPLLAKLAYGDIALRSFSDLDVLIRPADLQAAAQLLKQSGFIAENYADEAVSAGFFCAAEANFRTPDATVRIDLHWRLSPAYYGFGPEGDELWERATDEMLEGSTVRSLSAEDHLLYLIVHASRHGWPVLSQVCDIAHLISRAELNWTVMIERALRTGSYRMLTVGLLLARELCALELPHPIIESTEDHSEAFRQAELLAGGVAQRLFLPESPLRCWMDSICLIEDRGARVHYLISSSVEPTLVDWQWLRLPPRLYPFYYAVRPLRAITALARSGVRTCLNLFSGPRPRHRSLPRLRSSSQLPANVGGRTPGLGGDESGGETGLGKQAG